MRYRRAALHRSLLVRLAGSSLSLFAIGVLLPLGATGCAANGSGGGGGSGGAIRDSLTTTASTLNAAIAPNILSDPRFDSYLHDVDARFTAAAAARGNAGISPAVHIVRTSTKLYNVATLGAGHIYVTSDLLQFCTGEEELAACLSHAYAQAVMRQQKLATDVVARNAKADDQSPEQIALAANQKRATPADELEADRIAYELYARGGWDTDRFGDVFQRLADSGNAPVNGAVNLKRRALTRVKLPTNASDWRERTVVDDSTFRELTQHAATAQTKPGGSDARADLLITALPNYIFGGDQPEQVAAVEKLVTDTAKGDTRGRDGRRNAPIVVPQ